MMNPELEGGSWKIVAEAREAGNGGIVRGTGEVRSEWIKASACAKPKILCLLHRRM